MGGDCEGTELRGLLRGLAAKGAGQTFSKDRSQGYLAGLVGRECDS